MSVRLLVVDDQPVVRAGVRSMLADTGIEVTGEASSADQALEAFPAAGPHVVLTAVRLGDSDGIELISRLRSNGLPTPTLCFSGHDNPTYVARAMSAGAVGYLLKSVSREGLITAIEAAAAGEECWTAQERRRHKGPIPTELLRQNLEVTLTKRESEVLKQLSFGLTNKEIAGALGLRYDTVKEHVQHVLRKLAVNDRTQAAVWAVRKGLV